MAEPGFAMVLGGLKTGNIGSPPRNPPLESGGGLQLARGPANRVAGRGAGSVRAGDWRRAAGTGDDDFSNGAVHARAWSGGALHVRTGNGRPRHGLTGLRGSRRRLTGRGIAGRGLTGGRLARRRGSGHGLARHRDARRRLARRSRCGRPARGLPRCRLSRRSTRCATGRRLAGSARPSGGGSHHGNWFLRRTPFLGVGLGNRCSTRERRGHTEDASQKDSTVCANGVLSGVHKPSLPPMANRS